MIKTLLKKQLMEVFAWVYRNSKTGKNRSKSGAVLFALLYLAIFTILGYVFYGVADSLCKPLITAKLSWLYFALMGLIAVALGVFGSVFNTFSSLYQAKDNDLLLSLPIPPSKILLIRLVGVYLTGLMYELIVAVPTLIVYFMTAKVNVSGGIFTVLMPFILSIFILTLSCILGWAVALISSKLKNKNIITVILSLAFFAGYYYVYGNAYRVLGTILSDPAAFGERAKAILYPFYHMGLACEGNILSMLIFTGIMAAAFGIVYLVFARSFIKITTANKGTAKVKYKEKNIKAATPQRALLRKEFKRFLSSPNYMLNCGLGIVMMIIAAVLSLIYSDTVLNSVRSMFGEDTGLISLIAVAVICMMTTMNDMTAPSVSLEGKNIWIVQSLPVKAEQVLLAKFRLHLKLTVIPALMLTAALESVLKPTWYYALLIPVTVIGFIVFMALLGLFINLKTPNLNWTNEIVPIKQSMSVFLSLFGGWAIVLLLGLAYYLLMESINPLFYFIIVDALLYILAGVTMHWIKTKGAMFFERLIK